MNSESLQEFAKVRATEVIVGLIITAVFSVFLYAAKAYADQTYFRQDQFTIAEVDRDLKNLNRDIRELDYRLRDAEKDAAAADDTGNSAAKRRAINDINFYKREKDTLLREREQKLKYLRGG